MPLPLQPRVLCLACASESLSKLHYALKNSGIHVLTAATAEQAVASCVAETVAAAVIHVDALRAGHEFPVINSLKLVCPALPIILLDDRRAGRSKVPAGVDVVVTSYGDIGAAIKRLLDAEEQSESTGAA